MNDHIIRRFIQNKWRELLLPVTVVVIVLGGLLSGNSGLIEVKPGEIALVYNTVWNTDTPEIKTEQGTLTYIPFLQRVEIIDKRPQLLLMEGSRYVGPNHVRELTVRANDGSNFYFERVEIHYQIKAEMAASLIAQNGTADGYKLNAVATHARQVLRDEFGRYNFNTIADPTTYGEATSKAVNALNNKLNPLGFQITQIPPSKPRFRKEIEQAIEDRQNAEQEVEVQKQKRERLLAQAKRKVQDVTKTKNAEFATLLANLSGSKKEAENKKIATIRNADKYYIDTTAKCLANRDARITKAQAEEVAATKRAEGLREKINSLGAKGPAILDVEIAKHVFPQLSKLKASPFIKPTTPTDVRYIPVSKDGAQ